MEMVSNFAESWLLKRQLFAVWLISKHEHAPISSAGSNPPPTLKKTVSLNGFFTQCLKYLPSNILVYKNRYVGLSSVLFIW